MSLIDIYVGDCQRCKHNASLRLFILKSNKFPFSRLICKPPKKCTRVFINKTKPGSVGFAGWMLGLGRNSVSFNQENDLVILEECDKTVREICRQVSWEHELDALQVQVLEP